MFPCQEDHECARRSTEESDNSSAVPAVCCSTPFQCQEELYRCWGEKTEAGDIEIIIDRTECMRCSRCVTLGYVDEKDKKESNTAKREVDVEA